MPAQLRGVHFLHLWHAFCRHGAAALQHCAAASKALCIALYIAQVSRYARRST
jgi:hypothetical protein